MVERGFLLGTFYHNSHYPKIGENKQVRKELGPSRVGLVLLGWCDLKCGFASVSSCGKRVSPGLQRRSGGVLANSG